jgi:hypothetical protein
VFAVAASFLCFHYSSVGIWLPVLAYCSAGVALIFDARLALVGRQMREQKENEAAGIVGGTIVDVEKFGHTVWTEQLAEIVDVLGVNSPDIEIRIYPENTYDHLAKPLFTARPDDWKATWSRLRQEFGSGSFPVIVFVKGEIRRRFQIMLPQEDKQDSR